ncbi:endolytic transglycosylase MltG [Arcanobacterium hippocoleae]
MTQIFQDSDGRRSLHGNPQKKRSQGGNRYLAAIISLFAILLIVMALVIVWPRITTIITGPKYEDYQGKGNGTEVIIEIPKDASGTEIGKILAEKDVVASARAFTEAFKNNPRANSIQAGTFKIQLKMSGVNAVSALLDPASKAELRVTIPEGFRKTQVFERLANVLQISADEIAKTAEDSAAINLPPEAKGDIEGWIAPLTYELSPDTTAAEALQLMVAHRVKELEKLGLSRDKWERTLIVASIAQREVSYPDEYAKVARVIENRLVDTVQTHGKLQMESTLMYGLNKSSAVASAADLATDTPYNTHMYKGLPPGPISTPSAKAIAGAMNPAEGDWLYFVTVNLNTGETKFSSTYEEHSKYVAEFRDWYEANRS